MSALNFGTSRPSFLRRRLQAGLVERGRELEERVVHRPELLVAALGAGRLGGLRGAGSERVDGEAGCA